MLDTVVIPDKVVNRTEHRKVTAIDTTFNLLIYNRFGPWEIYERPSLKQNSNLNIVPDFQSFH